MPCTYYETPEEIRDRTRREALSEIDEGRALLKVEDKLAAMKADRDTLLNEIRQRENIIDRQERVICKMFNQVFDWGILEKLLATDKEVRDVFFEHQEIDQKQGRAFIAAVNGVFMRLQPVPKQNIQIKE